MTLSLPPVPPPAPPEPRENRLRAAATELEAAFLSEMLRVAGLGRAPGAFGGGPGEERFASYLRDAQARNMAEAGGIGLAESFYHALKARADG